MRPTVYECLSKRGSYSKSYTNLFLKESLRVSSHGLQMHCKIWICTISAEKKADFPADVTLLKCDFGSNLQFFFAIAISADQTTWRPPKKALKTI